MSNAPKTRKNMENWPSGGKISKKFPPLSSLAAFLAKTPSTPGGGPKVHFVKCHSYAPK